MFWIYFSFFIFLTLGLYLTYLFLFRRYVMKTTALLYQQGDAKAYLEAIDSFPGKLFLAKRMRQLMKIDAYFMLKDEKQLEELMVKLDNIRLPEMDRILICQKETSFYVEQHKLEKAEKAYEKLKLATTNLKEKNKERGRAILKECEYMIEIGLKQNGSYANQMLKIAKESKNEVVQGVYYYRAAKCYYYDEKEAKCREMLKISLDKLKGSPYEQKIREILEGDLSQIATSSM